MSDAPIQLAVIVGSTREGRLGGTVAAWLATQIAHRSDMALDVVDLVDVDVPTAMPQRPGPSIQAYIDRIEQADAFVVVTPEYNHGYPASLKQAIDLPHGEWRAKPVGFVSYGGIGGGLRAVEQLRQVFVELEAVSVRETVSFHMAWEQFDPLGQPCEPGRCGRAAQKMLDQLAWWATTLRAAGNADRARLAADAADAAEAAPAA